MCTASIGSLLKSGTDFLVGGPIGASFGALDNSLSPASQAKKALTPKFPTPPTAPQAPKTPSYNAFYARNLPGARNSTILAGGGVGDLTPSLGRNTLLGQ